MKKLIIITLLTLIGCQATVRPPTRVDGGRYSLLDVRLGMTESQIIEMYGDPTATAGPGTSVLRAMNVSGNKKLFCYSDNTISQNRPHINGFRFENGELVEFFQVLGDASKCNTSTAID